MSKEKQVVSEEFSRIAAIFRWEDDWASQPRAVWSGEVMERELDELFPVEVGLQALMKKFDGEGRIEAANRVEALLQVLKEVFVDKGKWAMVEKIDTILQERLSRIKA